MPVALLAAHALLTVHSLLSKSRLQVNPNVVIEGTDCDVSSPASVARLMSYAQAKFGRIDVWINNAGYSGSFQVGRHTLAWFLLGQHNAPGHG